MTLSIVLATTHPWPAAEECLRILVPQARATDAEILLADSTGQGLPAQRPEWLAAVRYIVLPGASVFALRAGATNVAAGEIIAWTEDHCRPASDWCRQILDAHSRYPDCLMIGGAVLNASTQSWIDWANFLSTFVTFVPPLHPTRNFRVPVAANFAFKRAALPPHPLEPGDMEFRLNPEIWRSGKACMNSAMIVRHVQSNGWLGTFGAHFHNGRSTSGMHGAALSALSRVARVGRCLALPPLFLGMYLLSAAGKSDIPYLRAFPIVALLISAHAMGELTGLLTASAGDSPVELE